MGCQIKLNSFYWISTYYLQPKFGYITNPRIIQTNPKDLWNRKNQQTLDNVIMNKSLQLISEYSLWVRIIHFLKLTENLRVFYESLVKEQFSFETDDNIISYSIYKCIFDKNMRATITSTYFVRPNNKNNKPLIGRSSSHQSANKKSSKNNKSKQKKNIQINDNYEKSEQYGKQGRLEYFNKQKKVQSKKVVCQKNSEYSSELKLMGQFIQSKNRKQEQIEINKLKLGNGAGVITFEGKIKKIDSMPKNKLNKHKNNSIQNHTDIMHRHSVSKLRQSKQSKSMEKKKKGRNAKSQSKSVEQCKYILKSMKNSEQKNFMEQTQTKGTIQSQSLYQPQKLENIDLTLLQNEINICQQSLLIMNFLKKVNMKIRAQSIAFVSKFCSQINLSKDVFFLAIFLMDRYANDQIILNKVKILSLACLFLSLKLDDCSISKYLCRQLFNVVNNRCNLQIQETVKKQNKKKKQEEKKRLKQKNLKIMTNKLQTILKQEFQSLPSVQQIIQFQSLILIKQNFKIRKLGLAFWIDSVTVSWDSFLIEKLSQSQFSLKLTFCYSEKPQNYYSLVQILEACLYDIKVYSFKLYELVFSSIFLICRINSQRKEKGMDYYRDSLRKSSNLLFVDKFGVNALFGEFLQKFNIQIGDILPCCKFISTYLNSNFLNLTNLSNEDAIGKQGSKYYFWKHYYNEKIIQICNPTY